MITLFIAREPDEAAEIISFIVFRNVPCTMYKKNVSGYDYYYIQCEENLKDEAEHALGVFLRQKRMRG